MNALYYVKKTALELRKENFKGANYIVLKALSSLIENFPRFNFKRLIGYIRKSCILFFQTQPTMAPLANSMALILDEMERSYQFFDKTGQFRSHMISFVEQLKKNYQLNIRKISENASPIIQDNSRIFTYSFSTTVYETLKLQKTLGKNLKAFITESRPNNEGIEGAQKLSTIFPTTLFIDAGIGYLLSEYSIDLILIGADSFTKNMLIHKIGTLPLAITAHELNIPIFILTHSLKYYYADAFNYPISIKNKPIHEVLNFESTNLEVKNYYFDRTPMKYITGIITEDGFHDLTKNQYNPGEKFPLKQLEKLYKTLPQNNNQKN